MALAQDALRFVSATLEPPKQTPRWGGQTQRPTVHLEHKPLRRSRF
jgi:hypothetical protein